MGRPSDRLFASSLPQTGQGLSGNDVDYLSIEEQRDNVVLRQPNPIREETMKIKRLIATAASILAAVGITVGPVASAAASSNASAAAGKKKGAKKGTGGKKKGSKKGSKKA